MLTNAELTAALDQAAGEPPQLIDPRRAFAHARTRRRRRRLGGCAVVLAAVATIAAVVGTQGTTDSSPATLQPVPPARPVLVSVNGVDLTWLPTGMRLTGPPQYGRSQSGVASEGWTVEARTPGHPNRSLTVVIVRDTPAQITAQMQLYNPARPGAYTISGGGSLTRSSVRGHSARVITTAKSATSAPGVQVTWAENPRLLVSLSGTDLDQQQLQQIAGGLVVHPAPAPPAHDAGAADAIRNTMQQAYTGSNPAALKLAVVQDGRGLAPTLTQLARVLPMAASTSRISVDRVTFLSSTRAAVDATLTFNYDHNQAATAVTKFGIQTVVLDHGKWLITRASYCASISAPGVTCPDNSSG